MGFNLNIFLKFCAIFSGIIILLISINNIYSNDNLDADDFIINVYYM